MITEKFQKRIEAAESRIFVKQALGVAEYIEREHGHRVRIAADGDGWDMSLQSPDSKSYHFCILCQGDNAGEITIVFDDGTVRECKGDDQIQATINQAISIIAL